MADDRTVHARLACGDVIVRLNRAGKWYRESEGARSPITLSDAVALAVSPGGQPLLGRPGGRTFDARVRAAARRRVR